MIHAARPRVGPTPRQAVLDLAEIDIEQDGNGRRPLLALERRVERLRLGDRARETVEERAAGGPIQLAFHHLDDQGIRHEVTAIHIGLRGQAKRRSAGAVAPQQVAGRNLDESFPRLEALRLRAFAGTGWPEENYVHALIV